MGRVERWEQLARSRFSFGLYTGVILALVILIRIPASLKASETVAPWLLVLSPLWLALAVDLPTLARLMNRSNLALIRIGHVMPLLFVLLLDLGFFLAAFSSPQTSYGRAIGLVLVWSTVVLFAYAGTLRGRGKAFPYLTLVCLGLIVYVLFNLLLYGLGWRTLGDPARMLGALGIPSFRVLFAMGSGFNSFGTVAGAALVACVLLSASRRNRVVIFAGGLASALILAAVLMADSRGGVICAAFAIAALLALPRRAFAWLKYLAIVVPLTPVGLLLADNLASSLNRSAQWLALTTAGTLGGRFVTWRVVLGELLRPKWIHLIGYGYNGHVTSGVSALYQNVVGGLPNPMLQGPHNAILQTIMDNGYVGGLVFSLILFLTLGRLGGMAKAEAAEGSRPALGVVLYLLVVGVIERVPTVYSWELFTVFLLIVVFAMSDWAAADGSPSSREETDSRS